MDCLIEGHDYPGERRAAMSLREITITVLLIGLVHAGLLVAAQKAMTPPLRVTPPQAIAVRWLETVPQATAAGSPAAQAAEPSPSQPTATPPPPAATPPQPAEKTPQPAAKAREPAPKVSRPVKTTRNHPASKVHPPVLAARDLQRPAPAQAAEASSAEAIAPAAPPATGNPARGTTGGGAPQVATPPRVDAGYLANPAPDYPASALRAKQQGKVLLRVLVGANGGARQIEVEHSCGYSLLDAAAVAAVKRWKFTPGRRGLVAVDDWVLVPIQFKLRS